MSVNVDYRDNKIIINGKEFPTTLLYSLGIADVGNCKKNDNDQTFISEQYHLRALDCMKDGSISGASNISGSVYSILYPGIVAVPYTKLVELEDKFTTCFKNKIKKMTWTKINKDSPLNPKFTTRNVFKESGLSADYFVVDPHYVGNFANEIVDPAGRSPLRPRIDTLFPVNKTKLILTNNFLKLFGFIDCDVTATRTGSATYTYEININGLKITNTNTTLFNGKPINWFQGNKEKNNFITNSNPSTDIKKGLLLAKEMGDVLQVLIMYIWNKSDNVGNNPYTMVTCDQVVYLQCMLLSLNCILTSAEKEKGAGKLRCIEVFEPESDTVEKSEERYKIAFDGINTNNDTFIELLTTLATNPIPIDIPGTNALLFRPDFFTALATDLSKINNYFKKAFNPVKIKVDLVYPEDEKKIEEYDKLIKNINTNFLFKLFIRQTKQRLKLLTDKKYTDKTNLWIPDITPVINGYSKKTFYEIGKAYVQQRRGGNKKMTGGGELDKAEQEIFSFLQFYEDVNQPQPIYYDPDNDENINLYTVLSANIMKNIQSLTRNYTDILRTNRIDLNDYYDDFRSELYYYFYFNNGVVYDEDLYKVMNYIFTQIFDEFDVVVPQAKQPPRLYPRPSLDQRVVPSQVPSLVPSQVPSLVPSQVPSLVRRNAVQPPSARQPDARQSEASPKLVKEESYGLVPPSGGTRKSKTCKSKTCKSKTCKSKTCKSKTRKSKTCKSKTCKSKTRKSKTHKSKTCKSKTH